MRTEYLVGTTLEPGFFRDEGGYHNEADWAARFPATLRFLFPPAPSAVLPVGPVGPSVLRQNAPNPFNPSTTIAFGLARQDAVLLRVFDVKGRPVKTLLDGDLYGESHHDTTWDGRDDADRDLPSGIYFYRLDAGEVAGVKRMVLRR